MFPSSSELMSLAAAKKGEYKSAKPFPHIILDNFFNPTLLDGILEEFPTPGEIKWKKFDGTYEKKLASRGEDQFQPRVKSFFHYMNSATFLSFLEELTGIDALISDPFLNGGGLHQIQPGGLLKIHADFNKDSRTNLDRRLNVLVYLNKNWKEEYGGHVELWDEEMKSAQVKVSPLFNRLVVFSTTSTSYHGHPDPLKCPEGMTRKSMALYYYTNGRPQEEVRESHTTLFQLAANEKHLAEIENRKQARKLMKRKVVRVVKSLVPPLLMGKLAD